MAKLDLLLTQFGLERILPTVYNTAGNEEDQPVGTSLLGTPVYSALEIKPGVYKDENNTEIEFPGIFLDGVLMTVSQNKRIVVTEVSGRKGSVKEFISLGDYSIVVNGILASMYSRQYPQSLVNDLIDILKAPCSVKIVSKFLQQFGIYEIVIQNFNLPQRNGHYNTQPFTLECLSDEPLELRLTDD